MTLGDLQTIHRWLTLYSRAMARTVLPLPISSTAKHPYRRGARAKNSSDIEALDDGDSLTDSFTLTASDGTYTVNLTGADEATPSPTLTPSPTPSHSSKSRKENSNKKLPSIDNTTTQKETSIVKLISPTNVGYKGIKSIAISTGKRQNQRHILRKIFNSTSDKDKVQGGCGADKSSW